MAVYVDDMLMTATVGRITSRWSHLMADTESELHAFARRLGMRRAWAQYPGTNRSHYDLTEGKRDLALRLGAQPIKYGGELSVGLLKRPRTLPPEDVAEPGLW